MNERLLAFALTGSRAPGFNHDCASKLQAIMMALDEITEVAEDLAHPELLRATETANGSLRELNALLNGNRALVKLPVRTTTTLRELYLKAGERVSVHVVGELGETAIEVALPAVVHAVAMLLDLAAELGPKGRQVTVVEGVIRSQKPLPEELKAIAEFALERDGGRLVIGPSGYHVSFG